MRKTNLKKLRNSINLIDEEMAKLFAFRLDIVTKIAKEKANENLKIEDKTRETEIIKKNSGHIFNDEYLPLYEEFMNKIFELSKRYQRSLLSKDEVEK